MIKVNEDFSFTRDMHGWQLHHFTDGFKRDKTPKRVDNIFYYASLAQVCFAILDRSPLGCESIETLLTVLANTEYAITCAIAEVKE